MKDMIEPFDIEKAKTCNYKIQTVGGCSVRILCYDRKFDTRKLTDNPTTIVALVEAKNSYGGERCFLYRQDGTCIQPSTNERCFSSEYNLVLGGRIEHQLIDKPIVEKSKSFTDNERQYIVKRLFDNAERFIEACNNALNSILVTAQCDLKEQLDEITNHLEEKK